MLGSLQKLCLTTVHCCQVEKPAKPAMTLGHKNQCGSCLPWGPDFTDRKPVSKTTPILPRMADPGKATQRAHNERKPKKKTTKKKQKKPYVNAGAVYLQEPGRCEETGILPSSAVGQAETGSTAGQAGVGTSLHSCLLLCCTCGLQASSS